MLDVPINPKSGRRRGGVYVAVLGAAMVVSLIGLASLAAVRSQRVTAQASVDTVKARLYAESGVELAMQWISSDSNWRTNRISGAWATNLAIDDGYVTISGTDTTDGSLSNRPYDPVVIQSTGTRGMATQIVQATLVPTGTPLDALGMAI